MKTTQELDVELALLKIDIEEKRQYEVLSNLKQRKSFLLTRIANATVRERREAERRARNAVSAARKRHSVSLRSMTSSGMMTAIASSVCTTTSTTFRNLFGSMMTRSRMVTTQTIGMRRCGSLSSMRSITPSTPIMRTASISRSRHTVKPKPPSGGLRVTGYPPH
jgi:hypothetical protein